ncbi:hypothetical protein V6N11_064609 [Hibiscus sabdariffa]|uniref:Gnk2-homologous domain-containing protein n=1 Tax=Hibiscus sabdariffa TaxID=183260 RepID=A0ABR2ND80_9ROSI
MLRYSNESIFSTMETRFAGTVLDNDTVTEEDDFVDIVASFVKDVASEAAGCTTLQSQRGCNLCLQDAITQFSDYFRQKQEATRASSLLPSCNVKYGSTPFYNKTTETFRFAYRHSGRIFRTALVSVGGKTNSRYCNPDSADNLSLKMWVKALSSILSFLLIGISLVDAAVRCYDTGNFTTNSTYGQNRDLLLASLLPNVYANGGFYTESVGQNSSQVYGLDRPFFGILELEPTDAGYNRGDITSNLTEFDIVWESLMDRVVRKASNGTSSLKYATGEAEFTVFQKIYAVMQCTPDLSNRDCDSCLRATCSILVSSAPTCWFRWDLYPFYVSNASTSVPSLSPPPPPASPPPQSVNSTNTKERRGSSSRTLVIIVVPIVIVVAVLVILAVAVLLKRIKKTKKDDQNNFADANMLGRGGFGSVYKVI